MTVSRCSIPTAGGSRSIFYAVLVAAFWRVGWLAGLIVKGGGFGLIVNIVVGIAGAFVGNYVFGHLGISVGSGLVSALVSALAGALILNWQRDNGPPRFAPADLEGAAELPGDGAGEGSEDGARERLPVVVDGIATTPSPEGEDSLNLGLIQVK